MQLINWWFCLLLLPFVLLERPVEWVDGKKHDLGEILHGQPIDYDFKFVNRTGEDLYVDNVRPACGCTIPQWSQEAVPPDSIGYIRIHYDAKDNGEIRKSIKVFFRGIRRADKLTLTAFVYKE